MSNCPVEEECTEVKEIKALLRRWGGIIIIVMLAIGGPSIYTWAKAMIVPELKTDVKSHEKRLTVLEIQYKNIDEKLDEIKLLLLRCNSGMNRNDSEKQTNETFNNLQFSEKGRIISDSD
jgi:chaperonin cofactor prefoldin